MNSRPGPWLATTRHVYQPKQRDGQTQTAGLRQRASDRRLKPAATWLSNPRKIPGTFSSFKPCVAS